MANSVMLSFFYLFIYLFTLINNKYQFVVEFNNQSIINQGF